MGVLESILSFISTIGTFISNMVLSLIQALQMVANSATVPVVAAGWVSPLIGSCITIVGAIAVIKLIVGWGNS